MATLTLEDRILTLTDENGSSSVDLSAVKGDTGPRGAQGPAGVFIGEGGGGDAPDMSNYYTKSEVDAKIPDVSNFITMTQVETKGYQTEAQVLALIQANMPTYASGDEVSY